MASEETIEQRLLRLEGALGWRDIPRTLPQAQLFYAAIAMAVSTGLGLLGFGLPNHLYQVVFAMLIVAYLYDQGYVALPEGTVQKGVAVLNVVVLAVILKLFIGGGTVHPFSWVYVPVIGDGGDPGSTFRLPNPTIVWQPASIAQVALPLTVIQTFLFLLALLGGAFEFQPFASLVAVILVLCAIPALLSFEWTYVLPALIAGGIGLYLQRGIPGRTHFYSEVG